MRNVMTFGDGLADAARAGCTPNPQKNKTLANYPAAIFEIHTPLIMPTPASDIVSVMDKIKRTQTLQ